MRGVRQVIDGAGAEKTRKRTGILRTKVGAEGSKAAAAMQSTLRETAVSRVGGNTPAFVSLNRETPLQLWFIGGRFHEDAIALDASAAVPPPWRRSSQNERCLQECATARIPTVDRDA